MSKRPKILCCFSKDSCFYEVMLSRSNTISMNNLSSFKDKFISDKSFSRKDNDYVSGLLRKWKEDNLPIKHNCLYCKYRFRCVTSGIDI